MLGQNQSTAHALHSSTTKSIHGLPKIIGKNSLFFDYITYLSRPTQKFGTMFKQMKKHSRMKCFKYNRDIEDDWSNKTRNMNSDQLQEALKHFASVSFIFDNGILTKAFSSILCWHGIFIPKLDNQF